MMNGRAILKCVMGEIKLSEHTIQGQVFIKHSITVLHDNREILDKKNS
jgi:hypothetical protein